MGIKLAFYAAVVGIAVVAGVLESLSTRRSTRDSAGEAEPAASAGTGSR